MAGRAAPPVGDALGYTRAGEQLADYEERVSLLVERMQIVRRALPRAMVVTEGNRRDLWSRAGGELEALGSRMDALEERIALRTSYAERFGVSLPLEQLRRRLALSPVDLDIVTCAVTFERGSGYNAHNQATGKGSEEPPQPDVAFYVALLASEQRPAEEVRLRFSADAPLIESGIILLSPGPGWSTESPLVYKRVRLAERVTDFLDGLLEPPPSVLRAWGSFQAQPPGGADLFIEPALIDSVGRALAGPEQLALVRGPKGVGRKSVVAAAAHAVGAPVLVVAMSELPLEVGELGRALTQLFREVTLQGAVLVLDEANEFADGEGQSQLWPPVIDRIQRLRQPLAIVCEKNPKWLDRLERHVLEFEVPFPPTEVQRKLWVRHLPPQLRLDPEVSIEALVKRYSMSCGGIKDAAEELARLDHVLQRGGRVSETDLSAVVRVRLAHRLGTLAQVVNTTLTWDDVILPDDVLNPVFEFLNYAAQRHRVMRDWGFKRKLPYGRGLSALFSGPPGTGKTMICSLLAKELALELYRIDLSQVVNKYIGETEKNLGRVFDEASRGQVMLLFDEADSIFAKRTEVKSAHDRYANLEVNYLLQRMENFEGVVVLTTNSETAIDVAFRRRIRFRIRFPAPDEKHRTKLWAGMMPAEAQVSPDINYGALAKRFPLAGGNIMNALVRAATAASAEGTAITQQHLMRAAEMEYAEMGFLT